MKKLILALCLFVGCETYVPPATQSPFQQKKRDYVLALTIDLSASFSELMTHGGKAYRLFGYILDRITADRIGDEVRIVLSQISETKKHMLWEGTPREFVRDFPTADAFNEFLVKESDPYGSNVHKAIAKTARYLNRYPGNPPCSLVVLSDLADTTGGAYRAEMEDALRELAADGDSVAFYFADEYYEEDAIEMLCDCGFDFSTNQAVVQMDILSTPDLPSFTR